MAELTKFKLKKTEHVLRHPRPGYRVGGRIWLERDGELYMGWGRAMLLERIDKFGSIAAAARSMKLGYRNAWLWIESLNRLAPSPLVEKTTGGVGGGYARLTDEGRKAVKEYKALRARFDDFIERQD
ncbi:MAG: LysR family transcriptional regulator [Dehalococcoidia bacterium]|jgi:molybdate transport system regulatory protein